MNQGRQQTRVSSEETLDIVVAPLEASQRKFLRRLLQQLVMY
jgi:hypothetical protein